jgi:hypothetical protein
MLHITAKVRHMYEFLFPSVDEPSFLAYRDSVRPVVLDELQQHPHPPHVASLREQRGFTVATLSHRGRKFAARLFGFQTLLSNLRSASVASVASEIASSGYDRRPTGVSCIVRNLISAVKVRFREIQLFADLVEQLLSLSEPSLLRPALLAQLFAPLASESVFPDKVPSLIFLWWLVRKGVFSPNEVVHKMVHFHESRPTHRIVLCLLFCFFAPEVEMLAPGLAGEILEAFRAQLDDLSFPSALKRFFAELPRLRENDLGRRFGSGFRGRAVRPATSRSASARTISTG